MATQARFDLTASIESWRNELTAQPQLTPDDGRELEKHLADSITDLRGRGLSDEESFWLARRRIGQPRQLAEEFLKVDPTKIWRERAFWMVFGLLAFSLWQGVVDMCLLHYPERVAIFNVRRFVLIYFLPAIVLLLTQRWAVKGVTIFRTFFKTRWRFIAVMIFFILITRGWQEFQDYGSTIQLSKRWSGPAFGIFWLNLFGFLGFPLMLLAVAIWLLPVQKQPQRKEKSA